MNVQDVLKDQDFLGLPDDEKIKVLSSIDTDFAALPRIEQAKVFYSLSGGSSTQQLPSVDDVGVAETPQMQSTLVGGAVSNTHNKPNDSIIKATKNLPGSTIQIGKDLASAIMHPIQTAKSIYDLAAGTAHLVFPGEQGKEEVARQFGQYFVDRYGSVDGVKKTFEEDPAGLALDIASLASVTGSAVRGIGTVSKIESVNRIGRALQEAAAVADPVTIAGKGVSQVAKLVPSEVASNLYQRSAKWSTTLTSDERARLTKTALDNEIMPTVKGVDKLRGMIDNLNNQIAQKIDDAVNTGRKIPVHEMFRHFNSILDPDVLGAKPMQARRAINNVKKQIVQMNRMINRYEYSPAEAQRLKQNIYKELDSAYAKTLVTEHSKKAQMAVARAAKETIEEIVPEIKQLNKMDGDLIELRNAIERASGRISNHDILSLRNMVTTGAGGTIAGGPGLATGAAIGVIGSPKVQARLAIVLNKLKNRGFDISPNSVGARLGLVQVERTQDE